MYYVDHYDGVVVLMRLVVRDVGVVGAFRFLVVVVVVLMRLVVRGSEGVGVVGAFRFFVVVLVVVVVVLGRLVVRGNEGVGVVGAFRFLVVRGVARIVRAFIIWVRDFLWNFSTGCFEKSKSIRTFLSGPLQ